MTQAGLRRWAIFLPQPPMCRGRRYESPHSALELVFKPNPANLEDWLRADKFSCREQTKPVQQFENSCFEHIGELLTARIWGQSEDITEGTAVKTASFLLL